MQSYRSVSTVAACSALLCTPSFVSAQGQDPSRIAQIVTQASPADGQFAHRLVTGDGISFHSTTRDIVSLQTRVGPEATALIFTWSELAQSGLTSQHYAIQTGPGRPVSRVRQHDPSIALAHATFNPLESVPAPHPQLQAATDNELFLVQFAVPPLPSFRRAIEARGATVHRFLTNHTFLVRANANAVEKMRELEVVRWVGAYHPGWKVPSELRAMLQAPDTAAGKPQRYSIMMTERGPAPQAALTGLLEAMQATVHVTTPEGFRMEATLTPAQLLDVLRRTEVQFVDPWGGPGETDMDVVRNVGGANWLESNLGYTGQGVRGEIFDTELRLTHQEWGPAPILHSTGNTGSLHGTSCYSINFAQGVDGDSRGLVPDGIGMFFRHSESSQFGGPTSRYTINQELINPLGPYRAVFQTSSVGSARTLSYTTISAETDDYLFLHQVLSTQSQSNAGNQMSRPQAWSKNIVSVGGIRHFGTATLTDDSWGSGGSIGPAADGRIKPDLAFFYDGIRAARGSSDTAYTGFGGTSAATPETAGYFGLLHQMWHEGVWSGFGGGSSVFNSRPKMATAKALMINHAQRYTWTSGGANADIDRYKQGWGLSNVQSLYDDRNDVIIVNETDLLSPLGTNSYNAEVAAGTPELRVTLCYVDPMGTVGAAQARINDLSLRVTSPGGTVYWGNNGLTAGNTSTSGGSSNTLDTVENVFLNNPAAGIWTVEVIGDEIVQDSHPETFGIDADYALVIAGATEPTITGGETKAPIPAFNNTFTSASLTRGMWFTAPQDFVITGLQVPDESGHGRQNVEVVRFNAGVTPPNYSSTTNSFTSLYRSIGTASSTQLSTNIAISAGDVIGILGACGDSTTMRNSYGASTFTSNIGGMPMTLRRMGMQFNLVSTNAQNIWTSGGSIGRVCFWYTLGNAEQEMEISAFDRTFSSGSLTRGYWFTCPADITITSLMVPDETGHGLQNVEVLRFSGGTPPPTWSSTTNSFTSLYRNVGAASGTPIPVSLNVNAGDVIGILGACGNASIMHNSYGAAPFATTIAGLPVTLTRMGMQSNLVTTNASNIWSQNSSSIGRVQMTYVEN
ncbi:MAG: S8 family serine peptidase [Planctomycetota bacterium]